MSDEQRQQAFAERLRRIEQKNATATEQAAKQPLVRAPQLDAYGIPKEDHRLRNSIIWAFIFAALGAGGFAGWQAIPADLKALMAGTTAAEDGLTAAGDTDDTMIAPPITAESATMSDQGPVYASPKVAYMGTEPLGLDQIAANALLPTQDTLIGAILPIARNAQCSLRAPLASEKVVNVRIENALLASPVQAFSDQDLANQLLANIETVTKKGNTTVPDARVGGQVSGLDVFLTDTAAPLYLVLQNLGPGVIWNIHAAPDVTLAHVAIIASGYSGLVDPPNDASFEALLVSDFVPPHNFGADDVIRPCMIRPWRNPQPDWIGSLKAEGGNTLYENQMSTYAKGYAAFNSWYTATLGVDASTNLVTARDAAHVLIGPAPAEPIAYRAMAGRDVHFMQTEHVFAGDSATRHTSIDRLHDDLLLAAIGGARSLLDPARIERTAP